MNGCDDLARACARIGLRFRAGFDRSVPRYAIDLRDADDGEQVLDLRVRDVRDCSVRLVDVDVTQQTLVAEIAMRTMRREPTFELWLEVEGRHRYLVARRNGAWELALVEVVDDLDDTRR